MDGDVCSQDPAQLGTIRRGRGGRRPGAGRKPNHLRQAALQPITAAEIISRRHPLSVGLTPKELANLESITRKLAEPSPDASRIKKNQTEPSSGRN